MPSLSIRSHFVAAVATTIAAASPAAPVLARSEFTLASPVATSTTPDFAALASATLAYAPPAPSTSDTALAIGSSAFSTLDTIQDAASHAPDSAPSASATTAPSTIDADNANSASQNSAASAVGNNRFFQRGSWRWNIQLGAGSDFGDEALVIAGFGVSCFLEKSFTIDFELNGLYFSQSEDDGEDTGALNLALLFRWHFWISDDQRWSIYADAGAGVMFSGDDVPPGGSSFNFTPQAGIGFSTLLDKARDIRLLSGFRWYHVSNANTFEDNPGLNTLMVYAGVNFPF